MFRIGLVVNPDAGLGGRLGLKGSDGLALKARAEGAEDRAGPRARSAMALLENALTKYGATVLISEGRMGSEWLDSESDINTIVVHESSGTTSHEDTRELVKILVNQGVDLILYAGGDGTTRDLIQTLEENESSTIPIVGIPCGVKMLSLIHI